MDAYERSSTSSRPPLAGPGPARPSAIAAPSVLAKVPPGELVAWLLPAGLTLTGISLTMAASGSAVHLHEGELHVHGGWALLVAGAVGMGLAMMGPLAVPLGLAAGRASLRRQGGGTSAVAVLTFVGLWALVSVPLHLAGMLAVRVLPGAALIAGLALWCALRQFTPGHDAAVRSCRRSHPIRPGSATADAADWGTRAAVRSLPTCAWPMLLAAAAPSATVAVAVTLLIAAESLLAVRPRGLLAAGYLATGVVALVSLS